MNRVGAYFHKESSVFITALLLSFTLSLWIAYRETVINTDAICYLMSAEAIGSQGIKGAMQLCGQAHWPFYSILVYSLARITHFNYINSAYFLNGLFSALSVTSFILIVKELGASRQVLWLAVGIVLLAHEFTAVRDYIVRDHGFWAFYLLSIFYFLKYFKQPNLWLSLLWSSSILLATLFRIEGAIFLLILPFISFLLFRVPLRDRMKHFLILYLPLSLMSIVLIAWILLKRPENLGRIPELGNQFLHGFQVIAHRLYRGKTALAQHVLISYSANEAGLVLILVLTIWYFLSVLSNLSWIYAILLGYAWFFAKVKFKPSDRLVLISYLILNIIITFGFLLQNFFLSKRYLIALSLTLMVWVPFALHNLVLKYANHVRYRVSLYLAIFFIFISSLGGIFNFGYSKTYIHDAGSWLAQNIPSSATLYVNDYQLMFYSKHFGNKMFEQKYRDYVHLDNISAERWQQYDYIALRLNAKEDESNSFVLNQIKRNPIQIFTNKRGDRVLIYKIHNGIKT